MKKIILLSYLFSFSLIDAFARSPSIYAERDSLGSSGGGFLINLLPYAILLIPVAIGVLWKDYKDRRPDKYDSNGDVLEQYKRKKKREFNKIKNRTYKKLIKTFRIKRLD